jgi:hypothetical protein
VACDIPLERSWQGLQLCFKLHHKRRFAHKVMGPQSRGSRSCGNSRILTWESRDKMPFGCGLVDRHKVYYMGGRWWLPPSPGRGESCGFEFARGLSLHQKCSNYALTNLLFNLCRFVWVIKCLSFFLVPSQSSSTFFYPQLLQAKERVRLLALSKFSF